MTPIKRIARKKDQAHRGAPKPTPLDRDAGLDPSLGPTTHQHVHDH